MNYDFSITYREVKVSWSIDAADYLKRKRGLKIRDKVFEFLLSLDEQMKIDITVEKEEE